MGTIISWLAFAVLGAALWYVAPKWITSPAEIVNREISRASLVGLSLAFLILPIYVLGIILLTLSIVGIVFVPFWAVLVPVVAASISIVGYFVSAYAVGKRISAARSNVRWLESPLGMMLAGLVFPFALQLVGQVFMATGSILGWSGTLLLFLSGAIFAAYTIVGVGAIVMALFRKRQRVFLA